MVDKAGIKSIDDTTYEVELPSGDKVEIGEREAVDFKPHIKLNRWNGECFVKMGLPTAEKIAPTIEAGKVKWQGQKVETRFYPLESKTVTAKDRSGRDVPFTQNELGGFEFEIILKEKPVTNQIVFDIQTQGLRFSYQPPLTQEEIDRGDIRPDNVVGSYAVYHATKKNNQYMTGKAFHIYRPIAQDALGSKAWCAIHINGHINPTSLTIAIPQQFLDEAVYPITIDPDFGYTSIGGSNKIIADTASLNDRRKGSAWIMPASGTANYIRAYIGGDDTCDCKVFINQKDSGGVGTHGQIATDENLDCGTAFHWEEFTLASEALTEAIVYILNIMGNSASLAGPSLYYYVKGDTNGAVDSYYEEGLDLYLTPENPWVVDPDGTTLDHSIYCNYTEAAAGLENKSANMAAKMVAGKLI